MSSTSRGPKHPPLAVVGASALFPGSVSSQGFWRDILAGSDLITDVPPTHWLIEDYYDPDPSAPDKTYAKRGAFLPEVAFDPLAWGVPPSIVPATDSCQLLALVVAQKVLEDACRGQFDRVDRDRVSCILGVTSAQELLGSMVSRLQRPIWQKALRDAGLPESEVKDACDRIASHYVPWQESTFPGVLGNVVAGRIANRLDLGGTNCVTDAACASTFSALSMAVNELYLGHSDMVICGGADTMNDIFMYMCFSKTPALSKSGDCRPFSDKADGTMLGEGIGMVALKRLEDAERDGDHVYAVLAGVGSSSDGRSKSVYAPVSEGQAKALVRAYDRAGYGADTVELVEAHGTGTVAGDAAEFGGLELAFDASGREDRQWCAIGSVKSQIGHTKAAAGAAGLFKVVMALHHKVLPPTIKIDRPNPKIDFEASPFYLNTRARPWIRGSDHPRRASVSSFGFGGSNFHLTLEEYGGPADRPPRVRTLPAELVTLSADSPSALADRCRALADDAGHEGMLSFLAWQTQGDFDAAADARVAIVAKDEADLAAKLRQAADLAARGKPVSTPTGIHFATGAHEGGVALLFPGQGSQYVDMGDRVAMTWDVARAAWDAAADVPLSDEASLHEVVFPRPGFAPDADAANEARLTRTEWAQPAIGVASLALLGLVRELGIEAQAFGGHSFGEVTALYAAGALSQADFVRVARERGALMAAAAEVPGAMLAVSAPIEDVRAKLEDWGVDVVVANHNHPTQVVLSGPTDAVDDAARRFEAAEITAKRLDVATAFHSKLVSPSSAPFKAFLDQVEVSAPTVPVYANATAAPYDAAPDAVRAGLAAQIAEPVRFVEQIEAMYAAGVRTFVEVGPGHVLTNLVGRILDGRPHLAVNLDRKGKDGVVSLLEGVARLAAAGLPMSLHALQAGYGVPVDPRTVQQPRMTLPISGTNYGKPYPPPDGAAGLPEPNPPRPAPKAEPTARVASKATAPVAPKAAAPVASTATAPRAAEIPAPESSVKKPHATPPAPARTTAPSAPAPSGWLAAYQEAQRQTAEAHAAYQRAMAESHTAFLTSVQSSFVGLAQLMGGDVGAMPQPTSLPLPAAPAPVPSVAAPMPAAPVAAPAAPVAPSAAPVAAPARRAAPPASAPAKAVAAPTPAAPAPAAPSVDLNALLLDVVADKTGYPADMLGMGMELEADLGVDSIKRVEILSAMREKAPGLPEVDASEMAALRTLGQIVDYMAAQMPQAAAPAPVAAAAPSVDLNALLLDVVADKTGYPADMLGMQMELEADLGVDSIKRVEILSAMREKAPGLPEVDASEMAALRTLGQIVDYMAAQMPQASAAAAPTPTEVPAAPALLGRFALRVVDAPAVGSAVRGLSDARRCVVTRDDAGVADALRTALTARGIPTEVVDDVPADADAVIFLGGLRDATGPDATLVHRDAFLAAKAVAPTLSTRGGAFVTVQDTDGDFGLSGTERAWIGGLPGLVKTAAQEWPEAGLKAIDIARADRDAATLAGAIADELLAGGPEIEVGLLPERRVTLESYRDEVAGTPTGVVDGSSVLVASGGARGVTAATLIALARATKCRIALLGRTPLTDEPACCAGADDDASLKRALLADARARGEKPAPAALGKQVSRILANREIRGTVDAIRAAGGDAVYVAADVQDTGAVQQALATVRERWGAITGLVHGAGVLADKLITEKTPEQFDFVFDTKVNGLRTLLDATADDPLTLLCTFSSVAARCGNNGQCDYAMANEVLNKVAAAEGARRGLFAKSLGWGPWEGGMVTPALKARFEALGVPLIPLDVGARMLVDELTGGQADQVELVLGGEPRAEALLAGGDDRGVALDIRVDATNQPFLASHEVKGVPVVPVALVLEWFARAARTLRPDLALSAIRDVRVLGGIRVPDFDGLGLTVTVRARQLSNGDGAVLGLEVVGRGGRKHYAATAEMKDAPATSAGAAADIQGLQAWTDAVYGDVLFHGPDFQVIRELEGVSRDGIAARMVGARALGWGGDWLLDPALLDGGLQLALLWTRHALGGASLPTGVGSVHWYAPATGEVRCVLEGRAAGRDKAVSDVLLVNENGEVIAELRGVETHLLPSASEGAQAGA